ncbi:MAG TPA: hypothetical protein VK171_05080 [Fimbriimonas sp.]|nr:hypothetical protein [Fimbriimonas sp.]
MQASKIASGLTLVGVVAISNAQDKRAFDLLLQSMQGKYKENIVALMRQQSPMDNQVLKIKLQRSKDGKVRESILEPLHMISEFVDDGKTLSTYAPSDKVLITQNSLSIQADVDFRVPLIRKNYVLTSESGKKIAGCRTTLVTATPKYKDVSTIRYYFDVKSGFPLAKESVDPSGSVTQEYEVLEAKFPSEIENSIFKIEPVAGYDHVRFNEPTDLKSQADAKRRLGFEPVFPSQLPYGFKTQRMTITSNSRWKALAFKLTDGIQKVTVFQWKPTPGEQIKTGEDYTVQLRNGLKVMIVADIRPSLRASLIRAFFSTESSYQLGFSTTYGR